MYFFFVFYFYNLRRPINHTIYINTICVKLLGSVRFFFMFLKLLYYAYHLFDKNIVILVSCEILLNFK